MEFDANVGLERNNNQLALANGMLWYRHVVWMEDSLVSMMALNFGVKVQRWKERLNWRF